MVSIFHVLEKRCMNQHQGMRGYTMDRILKSYSRDDIEAMGPGNEHVTFKVEDGTN